MLTSLSQFPKSSGEVKEITQLSKILIDSSQRKASRKETEIKFNHVDQEALEETSIVMTDHVQIKTVLTETTGGMTIEGLTQEKTFNQGETKVLSVDPGVQKEDQEVLSANQEAVNHL